MSTKRIWTVELIGSEGNQNSAKSVYGDDYFPRKFAYKMNAEMASGRLKTIHVNHQIVDPTGEVRFVYEGS